MRIKKRFNTVKNSEKRELEKRSHCEEGLRMVKRGIKR